MTSLAHTLAPPLPLTLARAQPLVCLRHYNQLEICGHFAPWEQPKRLVDAMRVGLKSPRQIKAVQRS